MPVDSTKIFKNFLPKHVLHTMFWFLPLLILSFSKSFFMGIVFLSIYTSFTFVQWMKYINPKRLMIYQVSKLIEAGYYLSTGLFLFLTGRYVYKGLMSNYVTNRSEEWIYCALYSIAITALLVTITYMIKTGKKWVLLCVVYLVFDIPGAMPFNFLHFYENQKVQNRLDIDKKLVEEIKLNCDSVIKPQYESAKNTVTTLIQTQNQKYIAFQTEQATNQQTASNQIDAKIKGAKAIENTKDREKAFRSLPNSVKVPTAKYKIDTTLIKNISKGIADTLKLSILKNKLSKADTLMAKLTNSRDRELQLVIMEDIKSTLKDVSNSSGSPLLQVRAKELLPNEPTQLESLEALYNYVGENIFSLKPEKETDERTKQLVLMSLIPSVIIDLLPLLFSIVFAWWNRNEEQIF